MSDEETEKLRGAIPPWFPSLEELLEYEATGFSPAALHERFRRELVEAAASELARDVRGLESVLHVEEFQVGMPFCAAMTCLGLWRAALAVCLDVAMAYVPTVRPSARRCPPAVPARRWPLALPTAPLRAAPCTPPPADYV
uniref:Uncharacterized protein n=1 Tax=Oryza meridionalis TaxID=40149 RepID=A0A0E0D4X0_9ORYZ